MSSFLGFGGTMVLDSEKNYKSNPLHIRIPGFEMCLVNQNKGSYNVHGYRLT